MKRLITILLLMSSCEEKPKAIDLPNSENTLTVIGVHPDTIYIHDTLYIVTWRDKKNDKYINPNPQR